MQLRLEGGGISLLELDIFTEKKSRNEYVCQVWINLCSAAKWFVSL